MSLVIGLLATAGVIAVYLFGGFERLEAITYDWRVSYTNSITADPRIVGLYIDDSTLERAGRWPWPREVQPSNRRTWMSPTLQTCSRVNWPRSNGPTS
jgi:CHASE2 domain-containing sensor protein